jgi:MoaE-MoaD fusion protein
LGKDPKSKFSKRKLAWFSKMSEDQSTVRFPTIVSVTDEELCIDKLLASLTLPVTGAAAIFTGIVRGLTSQTKAYETEYLDYEAYLPMAQDIMSQIAEEMRHRWPELQGIAIVQRTGRLYPLTPTIVIICTASHRNTGIFDAARYGIDRVKQILPVWKRETGSNGEHWVEGEH